MIERTGLGRSGQEFILNFKALNADGIGITPYSMIVGKYFAARPFFAIQPLLIYVFQIIEKRVYEEEMVVVSASVLSTLKIRYHPSSRNAAFVPSNGIWNLRDKLVATEATLAHGHTLLSEITSSNRNIFIIVYACYILCNPFATSKP
ncbi:8586_t:CDS:2 [Funneliformis caledonium]|uniref:8586_t:CDS:1 n=1 Tax=Funneliformis caledonium TaxID=1117310 RepID=A0A9N9AQQ5_9GLOM|nr:8586_t:CDS:2 [Funneliformis caledonium]